MGRDGEGIVIAGGGLAAQRCAETLRSRGYEGRVRMLCAEPQNPYDRPPLSKGLLSGKTSEEELAFRPVAWYAENEVELTTGVRAIALRPGRRRLVAAGGRVLSYAKLLIATGAAARRLPALEGYSNVHYLRDLSDARRLRAAIVPGAHLAIIGAGFIGQELASTASALGAEVTLVEALPVPLGGLLGEQVSRRLLESHREAGIDVRLATSLEQVRGGPRAEGLGLSDGSRLEVDIVAVGIGIVPATAWLKGSGLGAGGVEVDAVGRTRDPAIFAAGDVARRFDPRLGSHRRSEHWDAASRGGAEVAQAMLGIEPAPRPLPSFWSDQHGSRIQTVGHIELADEVRTEGKPGERSLIAHYLLRGAPVGALTVDMPREHARLRRRLEADFSHDNHEEGNDDELHPEDRQKRVQRPWRLRRRRTAGVRAR